MSDEAGDDVRRDDELARSLEVPPLDDVTRRRLVRVAMDRTAPGAAPRDAARGRALAVIGVAASLVVGVVVGAVVVTRPMSPVTPTAAGSNRDVASSAADQSEAAAAAGAPPQALGDLGPVTDLDALARAVDARLQTGRSGASEDAASLAIPCAATTVGELVLVSATGTATLDGRPVVVRIGPAPSGEILVVALDATACVAVASTPLAPA